MCQDELLYHRKDSLLIRLVVPSTCSVSLCVVLTSLGKTCFLPVDTYLKHRMLDGSFPQCK